MAVVKREQAKILRERLLNGDISISDALFECKTLANFFKDDKMVKWIEYEMSVRNLELSIRNEEKKAPQSIQETYQQAHELMPYRMITARLKLKLPQVYPSYDAIPFRSLFNTLDGRNVKLYFCCLSVQELENGIDMEDGDWTDSDMLSDFVNSLIGKDMNVSMLQGAKIIIPAGACKVILTHIKDKILSFLDGLETNLE